MPWISKLLTSQYQEWLILAMSNPCILKIGCNSYLSSLLQSTLTNSTWHWQGACSKSRGTVGHWSGDLSLYVNLRIFLFHYCLFYACIIALFCFKQQYFVAGEDDLTWAPNWTDSYLSGDWHGVRWLQILSHCTSFKLTTNTSSSACFHLSTVSLPSSDFSLSSGCFPLVHFVVVFT